MVKILQYALANTGGGITNYILRNYDYIDKNNFQFDFITYKKGLSFENDLINKGAKIHKLSMPLHCFKYISELKKIKNNYDIIHLNLSYANFIVLFATKIAGFKKIILHSHSTELDEKNCIKYFLKKSLHIVGKFLIPYLATDFLACSELAAKWMFPKSILTNKRYKISKNAIDLSQFAYNKTMRKQKRNELKLHDECFIIGHIARFCYQKNNEFAIEIFNEIIKKNPNSKLLLIGTYNENDKVIFENVKNMVKKLNLSDKVTFLGKRNDVVDLMSAMDCAILPSRFEGLPLVGVETQTMGLPSFFSSSITKELEISNLAHFISLEKEASFWAEEILKCKNQKRFSPIEEIRTAGYDIKEEIKNMEDFYIDCINNKEENINGN